MGEKTLEASANWLNRNGIEKLDFYGGEPLTNPYGIKYMLAKTNCKRYGVTTNGTLLDDEIFTWFKLFNVGIALSFDGTKETQDKYRGGSYDKIMENLPRLQALNANVLTTVMDLDRLYENVKHIHDLGFRNVFLNPLNPYSETGYVGKLEDFEETYTQVIMDFHNPPHFSINDFVKYAQITRNREKTNWGGCGINRLGQTIGPRGYIYPCHRAVELGQDAVMGSVFQGIDPIRREHVKHLAGKIPEKCLHCEDDLKCLPCPVSCKNYHGEYGKDPEDWYCEAIKTRYRVVKKIIGEGHFKWVNNKLTRA